MLHKKNTEVQEGENKGTRLPETYEEKFFRSAVEIIDELAATINHAQKYIDLKTVPEPVQNTPNGAEEIRLSGAAIEYALQTENLSQMDRQLLRKIAYIAQLDIEKMFCGKFSSGDELRKLKSTLDMLAEKIDESETSYIEVKGSLYLIGQLHSKMIMQENMYTNTVKSIAVALHYLDSISSPNQTDSENSLIEKLKTVAELYFGNKIFGYAKSLYDNTKSQPSQQ